MQGFIQNEESQDEFWWQQDLRNVLDDCSGEAWMGF